MFTFEDLGRSLERKQLQWLLVFLILLLLLVVFLVVMSFDGKDQASENFLQENPKNDSSLEKKEVEAQLKRLDEMREDAPLPTESEVQSQLKKLDEMREDAPLPTESEVQSQLKKLDEIRRSVQ